MHKYLINFVSGIFAITKSYVTTFISNICWCDEVGFLWLTLTIEVSDGQTDVLVGIVIEVWEMGRQKIF